MPNIFTHIEATLISGFFQKAVIAFEDEEVGIDLIISVNENLRSLRLITPLGPHSGKLPIATPCFIPSAPMQHSRIIPPGLVPSGLIMACPPPIGLIRMVGEILPPAGVIADLDHRIS